MKLKLFAFVAVLTFSLSNSNLFAQGWVGTTPNSIRAVDAAGNVDKVNVGIGIANPDPNAILDLTAKDKGLLIPRVKLSKTNQTSPFSTAPTTSLLVYNFASTGGVFGVTPGFYYWNGTLWEKLGAGVVGPTGPTGDQGIAGINGTNGLNGVTGPTGEQGIAGVNGTNGLNGVTGPTGEQGIAGVNGTNGLNGVTGPTGEQGIAGINGTNGLNGVTGPTGFLQNGTVAGNTPFWNGTNWVTNSSNIFNNGGNIGIGTVVPNQKLEVNGNAILKDTLFGKEKLVLSSNRDLSGYYRSSQISLFTGYTYGSRMVLDGGTAHPYLQGGSGAKIIVNGWNHPNNGSNNDGSNLILQIGDMWGSTRYLYVKDAVGNKRMTVTSTGEVGIATSTPTAKLHTVGTVRFESLPSGSGNVLVADANGNVFVSTTPASVVNPDGASSNSEANKKLAEQISQQQEIINDLQARLNELEMNSTKLNNSTTEVKEVSKLSQNTPNPFNQNTTIDYYVAEGADNAVMYIYNMQGQQIKKYVLDQKGKGTLIINAKDLVAGIYHYSLITDGKLIDTKKMILTN